MGAVLAFVLLGRSGITASQWNYCVAVALLQVALLPQWHYNWAAVALNGPQWLYWAYLGPQWYYWAAVALLGRSGITGPQWYYWAAVALLGRSGITAVVLLGRSGIGPSWHYWGAVLLIL